MAKTDTTHDDDRLGAMERRMEALAAENTAKTDVITTLLRQQGGGGNDVVAQLLERLERTDPEKSRERFQAKLDAAIDKTSRMILEPYSDILAGDVPFFVAVMEPQKPDASGRSPHAVPAPGMIRLVYVSKGADAEQHAISRYETLMGISEPRMHGLSKYMDGVFPSAIAATREEAEPVRKRCLEYIARVDDQGKIAKLMIEIGSRAFAERLPKPEVETLEKMFVD